MKLFIDGEMTDRYFMNDIGDYHRDPQTWNARAELTIPMLVPGRGSAASSLGEEENPIVRMNPWHKNLDKRMFHLQ
jgi:hypothetical protein